MNGGERRSHWLNVMQYRELPEDFSGSATPCSVAASRSRKSWLEHPVSTWALRPRLVHEVVVKRPDPGYGATWASTSRP